MDADTDAGGSDLALPGLRPGELKMDLFKFRKSLGISSDLPILKVNMVLLFSALFSFPQYVIPIFCTKYLDPKYRSSSEMFDRNKKVLYIHRMILHDNYYQSQYTDWCVQS